MYTEGDNLNKVLPPLQLSLGGGGLIKIHPMYDQRCDLAGRGHLREADPENQEDWHEDGVFE